METMSDLTDAPGQQETSSKCHEGKENMIKRKADEDDGNKIASTKRNGRKESGKSQLNQSQTLPPLSKNRDNGSNTNTSTTTLTAMEIINREDSASSNALPLHVENDDVANNSNKLAADKVNCLDSFTHRNRQPARTHEAYPELVRTYGPNQATNGIHQQTTTMTMTATIKPDMVQGSQNISNNNNTEYVVGSGLSSEPAVPFEASNVVRRHCELASPRCLSRESNNSGVPHDGRCPSNDSHCSGNESSNHTEPQSSPSVGLPLPASLGPAAGLLQSPQSAAVAAYLNAAAAAAAAQQNHMLLTNPLASLVHQAQNHTQVSSPRRNSTSPGDDSGAMDFSSKTLSRRSDSENASEAGDELDDSNLEKSSQGGRASADEQRVAADEANNSPLDLSLGGAGRKRHSEDGDEDEADRQPPSRKLLRPNDYKTPTALPPGTWVPPINPYLAAVAAASFSPNTPAAVASLDCWQNGNKQKISPNEATKALEKMTEMTRLGSATNTSDTAMHHGASASAARTSTSATSSNASAGGATGAGGGGRHSAWQSHWLNKGADAAKDVFKCVWCKQSFPTLATLTTHMKETQHCGVNVPASGSGSTGNAQPSSGSGSGSQSQNASNSRSSGNHNTNNNNMTSSGGGSSSSSTSHKSDLNLLIKETMPLPRKLVRGQDVWLGKGAEQTRQILKCMWCGQSFRSLAEMTAHMQETQHYTNIISQEQIISWKSSEDKAGGTPPTNAMASPPTTAAPSVQPTSVTGSSGGGGGATTNATVAAVLTCKVCDQAFATLKDLSNHMVKHNHHYKDPAPVVAAMPRPSADSPQMSRRGGRQSREKRKKSLPVRKLLELERAQQDFKLSSSLDPALKPLRDFAASTKITCEKCGDKIETALFVDHIRQCLGSSIPIPPPRNHNNNNMKSSYLTSGNQLDRLTSPQSRKATEDGSIPLYKDKNAPTPSSSSSSSSSTSSSTPSVLNALEQLIEKSFDTRSRQSGVFGGAGAAQPNTPLGASILKRLGIDDTVDYTKPLMDPQTMHFLRSYSSYASGGGPRDRSASESSSVSERCNSRLESMTPEHISELSRQATPRLTPDKSTQPTEVTTSYVKIKAEPAESSSQDNNGAEDLSKAASPKISVKKEFTMPDDVERPLAVKEEKNSSDFERDLRAGCAAATTSSRRSPAAMSPSPNERTQTPDKKSSSGSLNALSSMFDSLGSTKSTHGNHNETNNNNNNNHASATKKSNANPLAALQKLCDTTDPPASNTRSNSTHCGTPTSSSQPSASTTASCNANGGPGSMVAFSWACNDAVMTSADSIIKCSFCDTPFCSKGAYRHHLSKVHFVKEDATATHDNAQAMKSPASQAVSPKSPKVSAKSPAAQRPAPPSPVGSPAAATINPFNESPQSKFLKYTELARQLSSKNA